MLFALEVMQELGRIGDPRCADALALLESKRLADGGFPREVARATTGDEVGSGLTYAEWGPSGRRTANPLVSLAAVEVLQAAARAR